MVKFLINRPIAVLMTYVALIVIGVIASKQLPVSLLPDISIPEVTVHISYPDYAARELENFVTRRLRWQLKQCSGVDDISSETRDGFSIIRLRFKYGTNTDLAAIDVNEKIDRAMDFLPKEMSRPKVIKASATDIPLMYMSINAKAHNGTYSFLELSKFAKNVIRKRIEQMEEVALVDVTGLDKAEILVEPKENKMKAMGIDHDVLNNIFKLNNIQLGNITVKDGFYQYNIRFSSRLRSADDLANIYINAGGKIIQFKDLAKITERAGKKEGFYEVNGQKGISMAIIKQADARVQDLRDGLETIKEQFLRDYPDLEFTYAQDQSALLEYSIENLKSTLVIGGVLAFLVVFFFMSDAKLPLLIGLSIPVSVIISLLFFMLAGISVNVISLSGLILGIGLMIDNSIIVIDNISQFRERGRDLKSSCIEGTNEVIRPLLSSALTTSAVFIPLIFISGLTGALFYDQALTVSIGLGVSFIVSITFLPVIFFLLFKKSTYKPKTAQPKLLSLEKIYNKGFDFVFKYKKASLLAALACIASLYILFLIIEKENFPPYPQKETILRIDWNENITTKTSGQRIKTILDSVQSPIIQTNIWVGQQDYLMNPDMNVSSSEAKVYLECSSPDELALAKRNISQIMRESYPVAKHAFESPENIFEKTFSNKEAPFVLKLHQNYKDANYEKATKWFKQVSEKAGFRVNNELSYETYLSLIPDFEKIMIYNVSINEIYATLKTIFDENEIGTIKTSNEVTPVKLVSGKGDFMVKLNEAKVPNQDGALISLMDLIEIKEGEDFKRITADINTEYIPLEFNVNSSEGELLELRIDEIIQDPTVDYSFGGSLYQFRKYIRELLIVLGISLLLLYFILAAQFESMLQPLIILLEIPIDIAGALLVLLLFGGSLNIMSAIGIIVMTGIVINDSILKIDTINRLRSEEGMTILDAIHEGGKRRLRPIIMTSLTTILAVVPVLFGSDLGSELQKPLALAVAGGLLVGTIVSLYFIPLAYWFLYRTTEKLKPDVQMTSFKKEALKRI